MRLHLKSLLPSLCTSKLHLCAHLRAHGVCQLHLLLSALQTTVLLNSRYCICVCVWLLGTNPEGHIREIVQDESSKKPKETIYLVATLLVVDAY